MNHNLEDKQAAMRQRIEKIRNARLERIRKEKEAARIQREEGARAIREAKAEAREHIKLIAQVRRTAGRERVRRKINKKITAHILELHAEIAKLRAELSQFRSWGVQIEGAE